MSYISINDFLKQKKPHPRKQTHFRDFDSWNKMKKDLETADQEIVCNEREIWWCSLGLNIGHEQDGKNEKFERPVLIIKKFSRFSCLCVPLTTSAKQNVFHYPIPSFDPESFVITSQIKLTSTKRFLRRMGEIGRKDFRKVKNALHDLIN